MYPFGRFWKSVLFEEITMEGSLSHVDLMTMFVVAKYATLSHHHVTTSGWIDMIVGV